MPNQELKEAIDEAVKSAQAANEASNEIDQATVDRGVWNALYAQGEAIGALCSAVLILAGPGAS
jgi:hypothetical protein